MFKPPQHTIDHDPVYVSLHDPAWDADRILRETKEIAKEAARKKAEQEGTPYDEAKNVEVLLSEHPVWGPYIRGETRFDLDAEGNVFGATVKLRDYLVGPATEFRLKRLEPDELALTNDMETRSGKWKASEIAIRYGLMRASGLDIARDRDGRLTDGSLWMLMDAVSSTTGDPNLGPLVMHEVGMAVRLLSRGLSQAEKKA